MAQPCGYTFAPHTYAMVDKDSELRYLDSLMNALASIRNLPLAKVIRNASKDFLQGSYRATPLSKITHKDTLWTKKPGQTPHWVNKAKERARKTDRRVSESAKRPVNKKWVAPFRVSQGFAKASWITAMRQAGMTMGSGKRYTSAQKESAIQSQASDGEQHPFVRMMNSLSYLAKLDDKHNIAQAGIRLADTRILKAITAELAKASRQAHT